MRCWKDYTRLQFILLDTDIRVVKLETGEIKVSYFLNRNIKNAYMVNISTGKYLKNRKIQCMQALERIKQNIL